MFRLEVTDKHRAIDKSRNIAILFFLVSVGNERNTFKVIYIITQDRKKHLQEYFRLHYENEQKKYIKK